MFFGRLQVLFRAHIGGCSKAPLVTGNPAKHYWYLQGLGFKGLRDYGLRVEELEDFRV